MTLPFFAAIPKNMPLDPKGVDAPASAGPYYVQSWTKNRTAVFAKNPNYKGTRPRNVDQIVVTLNTDPNQSFLRSSRVRPTSTQAACRPRRSPRWRRC